METRPVRSEYPHTRQILKQALCQSGAWMGVVLIADTYARSPRRPQAVTRWRP